jgi:hypothetical protein
MELDHRAEATVLMGSLRGPLQPVKSLKAFTQN